MNYKQETTKQRTNFIIKLIVVHFISFILITFCFFFLLSFRFNFCCVWFRLENHLVGHHNYPKNAYRCETCLQTFCYRPSLVRHRALQHGSGQKYKCENCTKVSQYKYILYGLQLIFTNYRASE